MAMQSILGMDPLVAFFLFVFVGIPGFAVTMYSSIRIVDHEELEALRVRGELRAVMGPGIHFVPPFVSDTYPIDPSTMTIDEGDDRVQVPQEFREEVRRHAGEDDDPGVEYSNDESTGVEYPDDGW